MPKRSILHFALPFCILVFIFFIFNTVEAATLFLSPASGSYSVGQTFTVTVYVSSTDQAMNATSGMIAFPADKLQVISLSKIGSIINLWVQEPSFSNDNGTINFEGVVLNPGFQGSNGKVITITFKVKTIGTASLSFDSSTVLANDGQGTNILTNIGKANYVLENPPRTPIAPQAETPSKTIGTPNAPEIISSTHPDPNKWYQATTAKFSWKIGSDIISDSVVIDKNPRTIPQTVFTPPITSKEISDLSEGVWYLHVQLKNSYGWGDVAHFRVGIDTTPPEHFNIQTDNGNDSTNPQPILKFKAYDSLSGIDHYEIKIGEMQTISVPAINIINDSYQIPVSPPGKYTVIIRAVDRAGNYSIALTDLEITPIETPTITEYPQRLDPDNPLVIKGISNVCDHVVLLIQDERKDILTTEAKCENHTFKIIFDRTLEKGIYNIRVKAIDARGAESNLSEPVKVIVSPPIFLKIGSIVIDYLNVIVSLLALIILMILVWLYGWKKIRDLKKSIKKETKEAETALYQGFNILREEISKQIAKLDGKPGLSPKEKVLSDELKEALDRAEKTISKEIRDIRKKL
ncbi:MAG: cohesin domain-containing protein [Minisyncoccia bacterium]